MSCKVINIPKDEAKLAWGPKVEAWCKANLHSFADENGLTNKEKLDAARKENRKQFGVEA